MFLVFRFYVDHFHVRQFHAYRHFLVHLLYVRLFHVRHFLVNLPLPLTQPCELNWNLALLPRRTFTPVLFLRLLFFELRACTGKKRDGRTDGRRAKTRFAGN